MMKKLLLSTFFMIGAVHASDEIKNWNFNLGIDFGANLVSHKSCKGASAQGISLGTPQSLDL